jgi:hypothetical protein
MTMITKSHTSLKDFDFWAGAEDWAKLFTLDELAIIETILEDFCPKGLDDTLINDLFWFEPELLAEWAGTDIDELLARGE